MNSIDRKIARCQREIEAAKPMVLSLDDFRFLNHNIKGAAKETDRPSGEAAHTPQARRSPEAAPPSVQKFKVGDRVRWTAKVMRDNHFTPDMNEPWVISRFDGPKAYDSAGQYDDIENLELIPEPKAEDGGWVTWGGGEMPPYARVEVKFEDGMHFKETSPRSLDLRCWTYQGVPKGNKILAYRVVKP